jgi:hypothetical protein
MYKATNQPDRKTNYNSSLQNISSKITHHCPDQLFMFDNHQVCWDEFVKEKKK